MPTEDSPTIYVEYWDGDSWESFTSYAKRFSVTDGGILSIPSAEIVLNNKGGRFTSGSTKIPAFSKVQLRADVRGTIDTFFEGRYMRYDGDFTRRGHTLTLRCKGHALKLMRDAITYNYHEDDLNKGTWTMKDVIEDFLAVPDSGYDTGIVLTTDTGDITTVHPIDDFNRLTLLEALRKIGEKIAYNGYMTGETSLIFKSIGSVACSPAISLSHPFVSLQPIKDWEEVRNHIFPWGDYEVGHPPSLDRWTEEYNRWTGLWTPAANLTVGSSAATKKVGNKSIYVQNSSPTYADPDVTLDITKDPDYPSGVDCSTGRFLNLRMWLFNGFSGETLYPTIELTDTSNNVIARGRAFLAFGDEYPTLEYDNWGLWILPVDPGLPIYADSTAGWWNKGWWYATGSSFNWHVKKIRIYSQMAGSVFGNLFIDNLYFSGGKEINPFLNPSLYPTCPVVDSGSIATYGRAVKHVEDREVKTFEQATSMGQRELATLKEPIRKVVVKKGAKPWAKPHQTVTLSVPEYEISSETWRILELRHEWKSEGNLMRTELTLVPQTLNLSGIAAQLDSIGGLLRSWGPR